MTKLYFEIDGETVDPDAHPDAAEARVLRGWASAICELLAPLECAQHRAVPSVHLRGPDLESLELEVSGCCEQLVEQAQQRLGE